MEGISGLHIYKQMAAIVRLAGRAYRPYKREIAVLAGLSLVGGILEGIGINAVIPLLTFALGINIPATDVLSQGIQALFAWAHVPFVPRYLLAFIVILFMGKALMTLLIGVISIRITT